MYHSSYRENEKLNCLRCGSNLGPLVRHANHSATATCRPHTHPSTNPARRRLTSFICRTTLSNTSHRQPRHMKESTSAKKEIFLWQAGYSPNDTETIPKSTERDEIMGSPGPWGIVLSYTTTTTPV